MANLFFNELTITADRPLLDQIRSQVTAESLWANKPELELGDLTDAGGELRYRYDTKGGFSVPCVEALAERFPNADFLFTFRNTNESVCGFVEYADGKELRGNVFEDCGGY